MRTRLTLFLMTFLPLTLLGQNCISPFATNCWFNQVYAVRSSPDGTKFYAVGGTGPSVSSGAASCASTANTIKVYDVSGSGIAYNAAQSVNSGSYTIFSDFTANNGYFYGQWGGGSSYTLNFRESSGTNHSLGTFNFTTHDLFEKIAGAPNKMIIRVGLTNQVVIVDATTPASPTATTVTLPSGSLASMDGEYALATADQTENRIYYVATENQTGSMTAPYYRYRIKACTMTGGAVADWTDVILQRGIPAQMAVRPTDRKLFLRMYKTAQHLDFHGIVVIDKNGGLPADMNMADLSLLGGYAATGSGMYRDLAFDSDGNIYGNMWGHINPAVNVIQNGLMKFDPKGNLDMSFMRNEWNSYGQSASTGANSFDITDAGVIIKSTYGTASAYEDHYALDINHVNANNEEPTTTTYSSLATSIATWGFYPLFIGSNGNQSNYRNVQFLFNNGKLVRPGMTQAAIDQNCGISDPSVVPLVTVATGTINCAKTAFISAPVAGTASSIAIRVEIDVTAAGTFTPITLSGSGFSLLDPNYSISALTTGVQTFVIPAYYDGSALSSVDISVGQAGTCTADLSTLPTNSKKVEIDIWTPENCTFKQVGPVLK